MKGSLQKQGASYIKQHDTFEIKQEALSQFVLLAVLLVGYLDPLRYCRA